MAIDDTSLAYEAYSVWLWDEPNTARAWDQLGDADREHWVKDRASRARTPGQGRVDDREASYPGYEPGMCPL